MKCQIQWVDANGNPTPDNNDAVCIAVSTMHHKGDLQPNVRKFGCCAKHAEELAELVAKGPSMAVDSSTGRELYTSQWTREEI